MINKNIEDFVPYVSGEAPGCPKAVMVHYLRLAIRSFCEMTDYWNYEMNPITPLANIKQYELDVPVKTEACKILTAYRDTNPIDIQSVRYMDENEKDWRNVTGTPDTVVPINEGLIQIHPYVTADSTELLYLTVALRPTMDATGVDESIFNSHADLIGTGALARLLALKNKPWSDSSLASEKAGLFESGMISLSSRMTKGHSNKRLRVTPQFL